MDTAALWRAMWGNFPIGLIGFFFAADILLSSFIFTSSFCHASSQVMKKRPVSLQGHSHWHAKFHPIFELYMHRHDINLTYHICFHSNYQHRYHIHFPGTSQSSCYICLLGNGRYSDMWQLSMFVDMSLRLNRTLGPGHTALT